MLNLQRFLRDELSGEDAGRIEEHIGACPQCEQALNHLVGALPDLLAPPHEQDDPKDEEPPQLPGHESVGRIDAGGMGVIWRVRDLQFQRLLAVKVLKTRSASDPGAVRRFVAEAQIRAASTLYLPLRSGS